MKNLETLQILEIAMSGTLKATFKTVWWGDTQIIFKTVTSILGGKIF